MRFYVGFAIFQPGFKIARVRISILLKTLTQNKCHQGIATTGVREQVRYLDEVVSSPHHSDQGSLLLQDRLNREENEVDYEGYFFRLRASVCST
jgi:hypothetical protein